MICVDEIKSEDVEYEIVESFFGSTSYQGEVTTEYHKLRELFGKPSYDTGDPDEKVQTCWYIEGKVFFKDEDGEIDNEYVRASVYNWKSGGRTPVGEYDWHIGGDSYDSVELVHAIINGEIKPYLNLDEAEIY